MIYDFLYENFNFLYETLRFSLKNLNDFLLIFLNDQ